MLTTGPLIGSAWYGATACSTCSLNESLWRTSLLEAAGMLSLTASELARRSTGTIPSNSQARETGSEVRGRFKAIGVNFPDNTVCCWDLDHDPSGVQNWRMASLG